MLCLHPVANRIFKPSIVGPFVKKTQRNPRGNHHVTITAEKGLTIAHSIAIFRRPSPVFFVWISQMSAAANPGFFGVSLSRSKKHVWKAQKDRVLRLSQVSLQPQSRLAIKDDVVIAVQIRVKKLDSSTLYENPFTVAVLSRAQPSHHLDLFFLNEDVELSLDSHPSPQPNTVAVDVTGYLSVFQNLDNAGGSRSSKRIITSDDDDEDDEEDDDDEEDGDFEAGADQYSSGDEEQEESNEDDAEDEDGSDEAGAVADSEDDDDDEEDEEEDGEEEDADEEKSSSDDAGPQQPKHANGSPKPGQKRSRDEPPVHTPQQKKKGQQPQQAQQQQQQQKAVVNSKTPSKPQEQKGGAQKQQQQQQPTKAKESNSQEPAAKKAKSAPNATPASPKATPATPAATKAPKTPAPASPKATAQSPCQYLLSLYLGFDSVS